jgi:hypothetical protein
MGFFAACYGDGDAGSDDYSGDAGAGEPYDWFVQPVAGVILGMSVSPQPGMEATAALYSLAGVPAVAAVPVNEGAAPDRSGAEPPNVTGFNQNPVAPMQRLVIAGERIRTEDVAISAWFEIDGVVGVAVPAIAITANTVEVVVPALFDTAGNNVGGTARVQLWQATADGLAVSAPFEGLQITELPAHPGGTPGLIYASWLDAAIDDVNEVLADQSLDLPIRLRNALAGLSFDLTALLEMVDRFAANPTSAVQLPWSTPDEPLLTAASLTIADRLVIAVVTALVDELAAHDASTKRAGLRERGLPLDECPRQTHLPELDNDICYLKRGARTSRIGRDLTSWGTRFLMGFYLGIIGGAGSAIASAHSTDVAIAYEMTWAAGSGHVVSWATGTPPPSHAETQASVTVALVDTLAEARGVLGTIYSVLTAAQELDTLTRDWRDRIDDPVPPGPDAGADAGIDSSDGGPISGVYEGTLTGVEEFSSFPCDYRITLTLYVTIGASGGSGTAFDPYTGNADVFGHILTERTGPGDCPMTSTRDIPPSEARVQSREWAESLVHFSFDGEVGFPIEYWFDGRVESNTIVDDIFWFSASPPREFGATYSGPLTLVRQ